MFWGSVRMLLSLCGGVGGWVGGVCKVIFVSNPPTVLRLCYVVLWLGLWQLYLIYLNSNLSSTCLKLPLLTFNFNLSLAQNQPQLILLFPTISKDIYIHYLLYLLSTMFIQFSIQMMYLYENKTLQTRLFNHLHSLLKNKIKEFIHYK